MTRVNLSAEKHHKGMQPLTTWLLQWMHACIRSTWSSRPKQCETLKWLYRYMNIMATATNWPKRARAFVFCLLVACGTSHAVRPASMVTRHFRQHWQHRSLSLAHTAASFVIAAAARPQSNAGLYKEDVPATLARAVLFNHPVWGKHRAEE
eukprot:352800-Chlamydomonas_euryale.AAC.1